MRPGALGCVQTQAHEGHDKVTPRDGNSDATRATRQTTRRLSRLRYTVKSYELMDSDWVWDSASSSPRHRVHRVRDPSLLASCIFFISPYKARKKRKNLHTVPNETDRSQRT